MALRPVLDIDLLRTFVFIVEEESLTKATHRVGRTQSAVTLQLQKLETQVGQVLLRRSKGGPVELTTAGQMLLDRARKMLELNDEAFRALSTAPRNKTVRLGTSEYYNACYLPETLKAFQAAWPDVLIEVINGRSCQLAPQLKEGAFDLLLCEGGHEPRGWHAEEVWRGPLHWILSENQAIHLQDPLPLCLYPSHCPWRPPWMDDCYWRSAALHSLHDAHRAYRVVATADTEQGNLDAVLAGRAITVTLGARLPPGLRAARQEDGLPTLPDSTVVVIKGGEPVQPLTDCVAELIKQKFSTS